MGPKPCGNPEVGLAGSEPSPARIVAGNGEIVAQSEGYVRESDCRDTAALIGSSHMDVVRVVESSARVSGGT